MRKRHRQTDVMLVKERNSVFEREMTDSMYEKECV